jgi:hypothetical protein
LVVVLVVVVVVVLVVVVVTEYLHSKPISILSFKQRNK